MPYEQLVQTYAQAAYEQVLADGLTSLQAIAAALTRTGLTGQLDDANLEFSKKQELARTLFDANTPLPIQNLVLLLASKNQVHLLPRIIAELERYAQRKPVGARARITSAVPLLDTEKSTLEARLRAQFGDDLLFDYVVDAAIIGGLIVRVGDKVIDGSVAGKFTEMKKKLK